MVYEPADSLSREQILEEFPWADESGQDMIIGSDIDALMSAVYLHEYLGWDPIGFYVDFEKLYTIPEASTERITNAVWVDLDISDPEIASIGHHILNFRLNDEIPRHARSLNPNLVRGMYHGNFSRKYPLGTIHFLTWLHENPLNASEEQQLFYWIPDSTWINAQTYRENVKDWLYDCLPIDFLIDSFDRTNRVEFEDELTNKIYPKIEETGFTRGRGQVTSQHRSLGGYQCSFADPIAKCEELQALVDTIAEVMDWNTFEVPCDLNVIRGNRTSGYSYSDVLEEYDGIDEFIEDKDIFSYAIPNGGTLNYTTDIDLSNI